MNNFTPSVKTAVADICAKNQHDLPRLVEVLTTYINGLLQNGAKR